MCVVYLFYESHFVEIVNLYCDSQAVNWWETKWGWGSLAYTRISYQNDKMLFASGIQNEEVSKHAKYLKLERTQILKGLGWGVVEKLRLKPG